MLLCLLLLCLLLMGGEGRGGTLSALSKDAVLGHLQSSALEGAGLYLPVAVSPSSPCGRALTTLTSALNSSVWAANFVDSWGKTVDGILYGNKFFGVYDQCVSSASPDGAIRGKYCRVYAVKDGEVVLPSDQQLPGHADTAIYGERLWEDKKSLFKSLGYMPLQPDFSLLREVLNRVPRANVPSIVPMSSVQYDTCIPHVCTDEELQTSISQHLPTGMSPLILSCEEKDTEYEFTDADIGFTSLVTFLLVLIGCASLVDIYLHISSKDPQVKGALQYLLVFSAYTNLSKMFQVNPKPTPGNITCLHAMRALSMMWVIWCHQYVMQIVNTGNLLSIFKMFDGILTQLILNGFPSVDTFLFLSGLLVSYSILREAKRTESFNIILFYVHRYLRLAPPVCMVVGFSTTVLRFLTSGPFKYLAAYGMQDLCEKYWWRNLLFINNFNSNADECLIQTWYLGLDTQLYLAAPIIILPIYFLKDIGKTWLCLVTAAAGIIPASIIYVYNVPPADLLITEPGAGSFSDLIYRRPWSHAGSWMAGVWIGYIVFRQGSNRYKMNAVVVAAGWTLAAITGLLVVFGLYSYNQIIEAAPYEVMTSVTYGGASGLAWGAALGWVVFACYNGYGGLVNGFLSHPVWQPISRLTYSMYLIAIPVQYLVLCNTHGGVYYVTHIGTVILTVGVVVISLPFAILLSLMVESPVLGLEKLLLRPNHGSSPPKPAREETCKTHTASSPQTTTDDSSSKGIPNPAFTLEVGAAGKSELASMEVTEL